MVYGIKHSGSSLRIVVMGYIVRGPMGGMTWHHLQYVLGLHSMGHDVYYVEDSGDTVHACYDPTRHTTDVNPAYGLAYASRIFEKAGMGDRWIYYDKHSDRWKGSNRPGMLGKIREADLLINLSCSNVLRPWAMQIPNRIVIDTDPLFTQVRNLEDPKRFELVAQHTAFFTYGENIGQPDCNIPYDGFTWEPTRQPIVLDRWPVIKGNKEGNYTTVMKWDSYPAKQFRGITYGMKSHSFTPFISLPRSTESTMELAVSDSSAPKQCLRSYGWIISDAMRAAQDPWSFQEYLMGSKAEFSISKHGYVAANTGWFSDRSAAYLALGRPVLLQETGYSSFIESGKGLLSFNTPEEALAGIESINTGYEKHCEAARDVAQTHFSHRKILNHLIEHSLCKVY
jgi:hypothetical protein